SPRIGRNRYDTFQSSVWPKMELLSCLLGCSEASAKERSDLSGTRLPARGWPCPEQRLPAGRRRSSVHPSRIRTSSEAVLDGPAGPGRTGSDRVRGAALS